MPSFRKKTVDTRFPFQITYALSKIFLSNPPKYKNIMKISSSLKKKKERKKKKCRRLAVEENLVIGDAVVEGADEEVIIPEINTPCSHCRAYCVFLSFEFRN